MSGPSHAAYLPARREPPHDPRSLPLNPRAGWRIALSENIEQDACGYLQLAQRPGALRRLSEPSGSFAGRQLPHHLAESRDCGLILLDGEAALLKIFDPCECRFDTVPCTGGHGHQPRQFDDPRAIAICGDSLLVADRGNRRLAVYSLFGFLLRGFWQPPTGELDQPWQPVDVAISSDRRALVADPANGCVHVFNFAGCWLHAIHGVGAVSTMALDRENRLYVVIDELSPVTVWDTVSGESLGEVEESAELAKSFCPPRYAIDRKGRIDLGGLCQLYNSGPSQNAPAAWFDATGGMTADVTEASSFVASGTAYSSALDSRLYRCQWDRIALKISLPQGTRARVATFSAETELTAGQVEALDLGEWMTRQSVYPEAGATDEFVDWDCLVRSNGGRYLWLRIELLSDGMATPRICEAQLDFPRISLARYLPAVFGAEPRAADFTDRFLAIFDRGLRQIEYQIDHLARLFDPMSAPAEAGKGDFLSWLASWIGVTQDRQLPLATRRRLVKQAGGLYRCRGTAGGLRKMLDLYLGFDARACATQPDCAPCGTYTPVPWQPPRLLLEHFSLRRWLYLGYSSLDQQAQLWGQKIVNRSQLSEQPVPGNAQLGVTQLNTRQDPMRDPFHVYAHRFSLFLPAWVGRIDSFRNALTRLVEAEKPAHTEASLVYVEPRFRIGIQSMIGYDAVIGCYPRGVTLDQSHLGKATVLGAQDGAPARLRIGSESTIGSSTRLQ